MGEAWADFVFWRIFWRVVMVGVRCMSFFVLSGVLACTWLKLGGCKELGPASISEVIFSRVLMMEVPCKRVFFFVFFFVLFFAEGLGQMWLELGKGVNQELSSYFWRFLMVGVPRRVSLGGRWELLWYAVTWVSFLLAKSIRDCYKN